MDPNNRKTVLSNLNYGKQNALNPITNGVEESVPPNNLFVSGDMFFYLVNPVDLS